MDISKVGSAIAFLRKRVGYTQKDLADRIGISDKAVSKWERGLGLPDVSILAKLSILLDTDTDSLLSGDVAHHEDEWAGLLFLDDNPYDVSSGSILFDKPLVYYLLGYFLLVGIRNIIIVCQEQESGILSKLIGDGSQFGIKLQYKTPGIHVAFPSSIKKTMVVFGKEFIYGVDQTRFFKRAMAGNNHFTILALPKKGEDVGKAFFDEEKHLIDENCINTIKTQYEYHFLPIFFCKLELIKAATSIQEVWKTVNSHLSQRDAYVEVLDRGFIDIPVDDWESLHEASAIADIIQRHCGMHIYCLEEIAWRRGMIDSEQLLKLAKGCNNKAYANYLFTLVKS